LRADDAPFAIDEGRFGGHYRFLHPVVDNPYDYGAIAAANSLSDVK
jgi:selenophosphate synthase